MKAGAFCFHFFNCRTKVIISKLIIRRAESKIQDENRMVLIAIGLVARHFPNGGFEEFKILAVFICLINF